VKASLHESGQCHIAYHPGFFEQEFGDDEIPPASRFKEKWPRPSEFAPGHTLAIRVIFPWNSTSISDGMPDSKVLWISAAPEKHAVEVAVVITSPEVPSAETTWPGKDSMGTRLAAKFTLPNGETVWIVHHIVLFEFPPLESGTIRFFGDAEEKSLESPGLRAAIIGNSSDGSKVLIDSPVKVTRNRKPAT